MIKVTRHEITKDKNNNIIRGVIGITYIDTVTGKSAYRDRVWTVGSPDSDFPTVPTKAEFRAAVKSWLTAIPKDGQSILQSIKASIRKEVEESITVFKPGDPGSMVNEEIQEPV
ncbi:MAG: hypothetical protein ACE5HR_00070 [bacterium]